MAEWVPICLKGGIEMFKKYRKLTSVVIAALMVAASFITLGPVKVYAAPKAPVYVALGDSVSFGMSATNYYGYPLMMKTYLEGTYNKGGSSVGYQNLSVPGDTAKDLYVRVSSAGYAAAIAEANIITVNIGGNNLLQPVIALVQSLYPTATGTLEELNAAITLNPAPLAMMMGKLQDPASPESKMLNSTLLAGVVSFNVYWPLAIREIRILAPKAEIYANTLYSPVPQGHPLYTLLNPYIKAINLSIKGYQNRYSYRVVDVYSAFAQNTTQVVGFNISVPPFNVDLHPNDAGHQLIFNTLKNKLRSTGSRYYDK
jgi:lysophospholipase L1-like esterase